MSEFELSVQNPFHRKVKTSVWLSSNAVSDLATIQELNGNGQEAVTHTIQDALRLITEVSERADKDEEIVIVEDGGRSKGLVWASLIAPRAKPETEDRHVTLRMSIKEKRDLGCIAEGLRMNSVSALVNFSVGVLRTALVARHNGGNFELVKPDGSTEVFQIFEVGAPVLAFR